MIADALTLTTVSCFVMAITGLRVIGLRLVIRSRGFDSSGCAADRTVAFKRGIGPFVTASRLCAFKGVHVAYFLPLYRAGVFVPYQIQVREVGGGVAGESNAVLRVRVRFLPGIQPP